MPEPTAGGFLSLTGISKRYGGVRALEGVDFGCARGQIHAVLGENGAAKSTPDQDRLRRRQPDFGDIRPDGIARHFSNPAAATAAGVVCIFRELSSCRTCRSPTIFDLVAAKTPRHDRRARAAPAR